MPHTLPTTTPVQTPTPSGFETMGISSQILNTLTKMKITVPTPIQHQAIPIGLNGKDVLGVAQTGTGKTLAFGIPLIQRLDRFPGKALVVLPTRELAQQVEEMLFPLARIFGLRTVVLIGGVPMFGQIRDLEHNPRIIIATPGRLLDHAERRRVRLDQVNFLVLDEADRMLDMGFAPQINRIIKAIPTQRQTMLFSATMPQAIFRLATSCMTLPVHVEVAPSGTTVSDVDQEIFIVKREAKLSMLEKVLQEHTGTVLVFSRTKFGAIRITRVLKDMGHRVAEIHSERSQGQRREALSGFKTGKYRILIATDIAARGIDVKNIEVVLNFDLPDNSEDYVHRIGRTGRAGKKGLAISFATLDQKKELHCIERLIRKTLVTSAQKETHPDIIEAYKFSGEENTRSALVRPQSSKRSFGPRRFGRRR